MYAQRITRRSFVGLAAALAGSAALGLVGCGSKDDPAAGSSEGSGAAAEKTDIVISCIAREEPELQWLASYLADKYAITPQVFSDNASVNESVRDGSADANYFQNATYLDNWDESRGANLTAYGEGIFYMPYVLVSSKYGSLGEIEKGSTVLISNDASGLVTELRFLKQAGLVTLNDADQPTIYDVVDNPLELEFILIEPRSRVGAFDDADLMIAPSMNVELMGRDDVGIDTALYIEDCSNRNKLETDVVLTVTAESAAEEPQWLVDIDAALHSQDFKDFLNETYDGAKVAAF